MTSDNNDVVGNYEITNGKLTTRREVLLMGAIAAGGIVSAVGTKAAAQTAAAGVSVATLPAAAAAVKAKDFSNLITKPMEGLSAKQIEPHLKLYAGYVSKTNEIETLLSTVDVNNPAPNATYHPLRELLLEHSYALNGVVYHELYFGNLGGSGGEPCGDLKSAIDDRWGNSGKFMDFFKAAGKCMRGWVLIGWNTRNGQLQSYGLDTHNMFVPANVVPVVVLDVYEHAYMIDYGINRGDYLSAFLKNIDWDVCNRRLQAARKHPFGPDTTA